MCKVQYNRVYFSWSAKEKCFKEWSCVNKKIEKINKELKILSNKYNNATLVESFKSDRLLSARHRIYLNTKEKC